MAGPDTRRVLADVFTTSEPRTFSLKLEDTLTAQCVHLHSLLNHVGDPAPDAEFKFPWSALTQEPAACAAAIEHLLTRHPRVVAVLEGRDWIAVPFDGGDWK